VLTFILTNIEWGEELNVELGRVYVEMRVRVGQHEEAVTQPRRPWLEYFHIAIPSEAAKHS